MHLPVPRGEGIGGGASVAVESGGEMCQRAACGVKAANGPQRLTPVTVGGFQSGGSRDVLQQRPEVVDPDEGHGSGEQVEIGHVGKRARAPQGLVTEVCAELRRTVALRSRCISLSLAQS